MLVDSILQISPAYNPDSKDRDKKPDKKEFKEVQPRELLPRELPAKMVKT